MSTAWNQWQQPSEENNEEEGLSELTKAELQEQLEAKGLPTSGTKAELLERLTEAE
jgi:hypothetical protein